MNDQVQLYCYWRTKGGRTYRGVEHDRWGWGLFLGSGGPGHILVAHYGRWIEEMPLAGGGDNPVIYRSNERDVNSLCERMTEDSYRDALSARRRARRAAKAGAA